MKKQFVLCMIIMCACAVTVAAQDKQELKPRVAICTPITVNDTIAMNLKLKTLFNKETVLKTRLKRKMANAMRFIRMFRPKRRKC